MISTQLEECNQPTKVRRKWTEEEDRVLLKRVEAQKNAGCPSDWKAIARRIPGRSNKDCRKRWNKIRACLAKGPWSMCEDESLKGAVRLHGFRWIDVSRVVKTRNADQCAKRWRYAIDPSIDRSVWRPEEDETLVSAVAQHGQSWKTISQRFLPTRATTDIKNRYVTIMRSKRKAQSTTPRPAKPKPANRVSLPSLTSEMSSPASISGLDNAGWDFAIQSNYDFTVPQTNYWIDDSIAMNQHDAHVSLEYASTQDDHTTLSPVNSHIYQPSTAPVDWLAGASFWTGGSREGCYSVQPEGLPFQNDFGTGYQPLWLPAIQPHQHLGYQF